MSADLIPQLDSAGDADPELGEGNSSSVSTATDTSSGGLTGQPRAKKTPEEIIRGLQSENDRVKSKFGKLLSSDHAKRLGEEGILELIDQTIALVSHPDIGSQLRNGALVKTSEGQWKYQPTASQKAASVDAAAGLDGAAPEYEDPIVKQIEARMEAKYGGILANLNEQVTSLRHRGDTALNETSTQKVEDLTRRFLVNYPLSPEERASFAERIGPRIANLDPTVVLKMNDEQFEDYVGLPNVKQFLPAILARKAKQRGSQLADLATDANGTASAGAEQSPARQKFMSMTQLKKELAQAAERAAREPA